MAAANRGLLPPAITRIVQEQWKRLSQEERNQWPILSEVRLAICYVLYESGDNSILTNLRFQTTRTANAVRGMSISPASKMKTTTPVGAAPFKGIPTQWKIRGLRLWFKTEHVPLRHYPRSHPCFWVSMIALANQPTCAARRTSLTAALWRWRIIGTHPFTSPSMTATQCKITAWIHIISSLGRFQTLRDVIAEA